MECDFDFSSNGYFPSYNDLRVHCLMLLDNPRVEVYKQAILNSREYFKGKIVLDVGAGTGILSIFCAQAGAKHVYAVEAASDMIPIIKGVVEENNFSDVITVIEGAVEDLPDIGSVTNPDKPQALPELVDIIVSEWMGFFLLHECMIESVMYARKFLKEDGMMFPYRCSIFAALCELPQFNDDWNDFHGVRMSTFSTKLRSSFQNEPQICSVKKENLLSEPTCIFSFKVKDVTKESLQDVSGRYVLVALRDGKYQGLCLWFTASFRTPSGDIVLSTSPSAPITHWKQTLIVFPEEIEVGQSEPIGFDLHFHKNGPRTYQISYTGVEDIPHPTPCDCFRMDCRLIKTFLKDTVNK